MKFEEGKVWNTVLSIIEADRKELTDLCLHLGAMSSPSGKERKVAESVVEWFNGNGLEGHLQPITEESANAIGLLRGTGDGRSLICDAHTDNSPFESITEIGQRMNTGFVEGDLIYGNGIINDKAQLAAFMIAARAIKKANVRLKGDLTIAAVATEIGQPSVDESQGVNYPGEGFGSRWMIDRGVVADYALIGETSSFGIVPVECGAVHLKITLFGRSVYTPRLVRGKTWQEDPNAIVKAAHLILALEDWASKYEEREKVKFNDGQIVPKAQIVGIRAGREFNITSEGAPNSCSIFIDIRIAPGVDPKRIRSEILRLTESSGAKCDVTVYQWSRGHIAQRAEPLIDALKVAHKYVLGTDTPSPNSSELSMWRDLNAFNEVGIPSVCFGPPRQREHYSDAQNRAMKIVDLIAATKIYAITIMQICGISN